MRLRITPLAAVCALALMARVTATADQGVNDPELSGYIRIAREYWREAPLCNGPNGQAVGPQVAIANNPDPGVAAWAEQPGCRMWLDSDHWPAPPDEQHCNLIAHEWGHLLGHTHSSDPHSLMWGGWTNNVVPGCAV